MGSSRQELVFSCGGKGEVLVVSGGSFRPVPIRNSAPVWQEEGKKYGALLESHFHLVLLLSLL